MNNLVALVISLLFAIVLSMAVGFVVASINGYDFAFGNALPYGLVLGLIIFLFSAVITAEER